jgi:CBS domain-containing protein
MTTARDIMSGGAECAQTSDTVQEAAQKMKDLGVGALPICGEDNRLKGMITDRDIVLKCVVGGHDVTQMKVEEYAGDEVVTIGADDSVEEALATMSRAGVRRLPVVDGHDLVGMVSQADIARNLPEDKVGDLVEAISSAPSDAA